MLGALNSMAKYKRLGRGWSQVLLMFFVNMDMTDLIVANILVSYFYLGAYTTTKLLGALTALRHLLVRLVLINYEMFVIDV